jgi:hypothetical protein
MGHPDGAHTHGSNGGGGLAVVVVLAILAAVLHAIWRQLVEVVEITGLVILGMLGLALGAGAVYAGVRIRRRVLDARYEINRTARYEINRTGRARVIQLDGRTERPAIGAPRQRPAAWPLSGWRQEVKPADEARPDR